MTHAEEQARIEAAIARWRPLLGLTDWDITLNFHDGEFIDQEGSASGRGLAVTFTEWQYQRASIAFNTVHSRDLSDGRLDSVAVHELCHVLVNETQYANLPLGWNRDRGDQAHEERVVTMLARAFLAVAGYEWEMVGGGTGETERDAVEGSS